MYNLRVSFGYRRNPGARALVTVQNTKKRIKIFRCLVFSTSLRNSSTLAFNFTTSPSNPEYTFTVSITYSEQLILFHSAIHRPKNQPFLIDFVSVNS